MRIPRWLVIPFIVISLIALTRQFWDDQTETAATVYDIPKKLDTELLTLKVYPQSKSNNVFVFTTYKEGSEDDFLYLTPENIALETPSQIMDLPDSILQKGFQVSGYFYIGTGIPKEYIGNIPKVKRLRVFLYQRIDGLSKPVKVDSTHLTN